ncbi:RagB/SusD family nutrient uptake outer membrane protein [Phocaeicola sartorii]|uniref:RagB/SusD family nutrient uptake outer membrane protein n=1 Tax=Phocaeicola sartorii TaxID=671267 RepID=UPI0035142D99
MKRKFNIGTFAVMSMLAFSSCNDVLDKAPLDLVTEDMVWSDEGMAQSYLNRIWYATGRFDYQNETWFSLYAGPLTPGTDIVSDNPYCRWNRNGSVVRNDAGWTENTNNGLFDNFIDIRRANIAIDKLTAGCGFRKDIEDDMLGQAYFGKGLVYVTRAKSFGGYPIIDKTLTIDDELSLPRASIKETFDYGIGLLEKAAELLNRTSPSGRPNKGAAYALLSEAYLNAAAYIKYAMINNEQSTVDVTPYLDGAISSVARLEALGLYELEPAGSNWGKQFNDFSYVSGSPKEVILAQFTPPGLYPLSNDKMVEINCYLPTMVADNLKTDIINNYGGAPYPGFTPSSGWQTIAPNPTVIEETFYIVDLDGKARRWEESQMFERYVELRTDGTRALNAQAASIRLTDISALMYENRDKRFYETVAYDGGSYFGNPFDSRKGGNMHPESFKAQNSAYGAVTGYLFVKSVPQTQSWTSTDLSGFHRTCLRLSKAYLNAAEAYLLKEDWSNARNFINRTRTTHGGLPALTEETDGELWKIYLDERNAELMLENDRYFTLLRYGINRLNAEVIDQLNRGNMKKLDIAADGASYQYVELPFEVDANKMVFNRYRYLYPIAKTYIDANPNYKQNPRY